MGPAKKTPGFKPFKINLLIRRGEKVALLTRLIKWTLTSGKLIVVLVEIITIGAFVMRYKLDGDLSQLQDSIKNEVPYLESLKADELLIRQTQFKIATIRQTKTETLDFSQVITKIANITPKNIKISNIAFDRTQSFPKTLFNLSGTTPSNIELSVFMSSLQKDPSFTEVTLTNISFEGQILFTITGSLTGKGGKNS